MSERMMNPLRDALFNENGEEGKADGFFFVEDGIYKAVLVAHRRPNRSAPRSRERIVSGTYFGADARHLAGVLRKAGWQPPRGLAKLCERAPRSSWRRHV